jgi:hypothetical protein
MSQSRALVDLAGVANSPGGQYHPLGPSVGKAEISKCTLAIPRRALTLLTNVRGVLAVGGVNTIPTTWAEGCQSLNVMAVVCQ